MSLIQRAWYCLVRLWTSSELVSLKSKTYNASGPRNWLVIIRAVLKRNRSLLFGECSYTQITFQTAASLALSFLVSLTSGCMFLLAWWQLITKKNMQWNLMRGKVLFLWWDLITKKPLERRDRYEGRCASFRSLRSTWPESHCLWCKKMRKNNPTAHFSLSWAMNIHEKKLIRIWYCMQVPFDEALGI